MFEYFKRKFRIRRLDEDGEPHPLIWVDGSGQSILIDPASGRAHAHLVSGGLRQPEPPVRPFWVGNPNEATFFDAQTRMVLAYIWADGRKKLHPIVYVRPAEAFRIIKNRQGRLVSFRPIPRCAIEMNGSSTMEAARQAVEVAFGEHA